MIQYMLNACHQKSNQSFTYHWEGHPDRYRQERHYIQVLAQLSEELIRVRRLTLKHIQKGEGATEHWQNACGVWAREIFEPQHALSENLLVDLVVEGQTIDHRHVDHVDGKLEQVRQGETHVDPVLLPKSFHLVSLLLCGLFVLHKNKGSIAVDLRPSSSSV